MGWVWTHLRGAGGTALEPAGYWAWVDPREGIHLPGGRAQSSHFTLKLWGFDSLKQTWTLRQEPGLSPEHGLAGETESEGLLTLPGSVRLASRPSSSLISLPWLLTSSHTFSCQLLFQHSPCPSGLAPSAPASALASHPPAPSTMLPDTQAEPVPTCVTLAEPSLANSHHLPIQS